MPSISTRVMPAVFLISAMLLGFETLTIRLVSVLVYPVAAYLVISLALLGLGVGGGVVAMRRPDRDSDETPAAIAAFGSALAFVLSMAWVWLVGRAGWAAPLLPLFLALPFGFGGYALSSCLALPGLPVSRVYFADLVGAGLAAAAVLLGFSWLTALQMGLALAALGLAAGVLLSPRPAMRVGAVLGAIILGAAAAMLKAPDGIVPISPKELALILRTQPQAVWEHQSWGSIARVDVVSVPGGCTELGSGVECKLVTQDGGAPTVLIGARSREALAGTIFGLPYWLRDEPRVLIIGLGGAPDVLAAEEAGAIEITGVEVNDRMVELVDDVYADFTGHPYDDSRVSIVVGDGRNFLRESPQTYDVIQLTGVDTSVASLGAAPNLAENYLYTSEAFGEYYDRLSPRGLLSVSFPNVDGLGLRLLATVWEALNGRGVDDIRDRVAVSEISGFVHVLVARMPLSGSDVAALQSHLQAGATSLYFPLYHRLFGTPTAEFIRETRLLSAPGLSPTGAYAEFFTAMEDDRLDEFLASRPQTVTPSTDDKPFFFVLDRWGERAPNLEAIALTVAILALAAVALMISPLLLQHRRGLKLEGSAKLGIYFVALGLGYMLVEVALIQRFTLLLGHPSYAVVVVLGSLLVASGLGSLLSGRWSMRWWPKVRLACLVVVILIVAEAAAFRWGVLMAPAIPRTGRFLLAIVLAGLPGFWMGIPFPTGLEAVKRLAPAFVAWGWALNGVASVTASLLAVLIAISSGLTSVSLLAGALYLGAAVAFGSWQERGVLAAKMAG